MTLIITTKINQTQTNMAEKKNIHEYDRETYSPGIEALKKYRKSGIIAGILAPETEEERALWLEAHGAEFSGELLTPQN